MEKRKGGSWLWCAGLVCGFVWGLVAMGPGLAEGEEAGRSYAILIGIDQYRASSLHPDHTDYVGNLEQTVNDVRKMQAFLVKAGFPEKDMTVLLNEKATKAAILAALERLAKKVKPRDRVFFHFSGHGYQITRKEASLVVHDTLRTVTASHVTGTEFREWLGRLKTQKAFFLLDACHAGGLFPSGRRGADCPRRGKRRYLRNRELEEEMKKELRADPAGFQRLYQKGRGLKTFLTRGAMLIWMAARYDQYACESQSDQGGVFTTVFLQEASGWLGKAGATFLDLQQGLRQRFREVPYSVYQGVQTPILLGDPNHPLFFRTSPSKPPSSRPPASEEQAKATACQKETGLCLTFWATKADDPSQSPSLRFRVGERTKMHVTVSQASRITLLIQNSQGITRTIVKDRRLRGGETYTRGPFRVKPPPGPVFIIAEAWPSPTGKRGDWEEESEASAPPARRPVRIKLAVPALP